MAGVALLFVVGTNGCAVLGFFGYALFPDKVKAAYELEDRPTVIVVDDPSQVLEDHELLYEIGHGIGEQLMEHQVLRQIVPGEKLLRLEAKLGDEYSRLPIDQLGQDLGADQVVHTAIEKVMVSQVRITLVCQVKVIDARDSVRLFPSPNPPRPPASARDIGLVTTQLIYQPVSELGPGRREMVNREMARRVSVEVARLFYDYQVPDRNEAFGEAPS